MKITILCNTVAHPVNEMLDKWIIKQRSDHDIKLVRSRKEIEQGELLFLISCSEIISASDRARYLKTLVLHASDLPKGRGWSPHIWDIIDGAEQITVTLLEAGSTIDTGAIWKKCCVSIPKHALHDEINEIIFQAESELMDYAVDNFLTVQAIDQDQSIEPTYYPRRKPEQSEIDPHKALSSQFDLLRVCDPDRYPAYFQLHGHRYKITLGKVDDE